MDVERVDEIVDGVARRVVASFDEPPGLGAQADVGQVHGLGAGFGHEDAAGADDARGRVPGGRAAR